MPERGPIDIAAQTAQDAPAPLSVLVIEDDDMQATLVRRWLEDTQRFAVTVAPDGLHGYDLLMSKRWELVISDIRLPHIDGLALLSSFRTQNRETPFLLMSGCARFDDVQKAVRLEAGDLLVKPLERGTFVNRALSLIQVSSRRQEGSPQEAQSVPTSAVSAVVNGIAQQLANKMTLPIGYADLLSIELARHEPDVESCRELVQNIAESADALARSLQSLRRLVRQSSTSAAPIELGDLVREVCHTVCVYGDRLHAPVPISVAVDAGADIRIQGDPVQLRLVIAALLFSAADIGGSDPSLSVRAYHDRTRAIVEVFGRCERDTRSLDAFAVAKWLPFGRWAPGAMSPAIGLDADVTVSVDVRPDGLAFRLVAGRLQNPATSLSGDSSALRVEFAGRRILLFGGHIERAETTAGALRAGAGCEVDVAHSPSDAWRLFDGHRYDLVLIDLQQKDEHGMTFLSGLRSVAPDLAKSAIVMADDPALTEQAGASQFVPASGTNGELLRAVRSGMAGLDGGREQRI